MVSATQLSSYLYCPRKLYLGSVLLLQEPIKSEIIKGKIWHETHELLNNTEEKIVCEIKVDKYQDILDLYRKQYSKHLRNTIIRHKSELKQFEISMIDIFKEYWPSFEEEACEHALNVVNFINTHHVFGKELWDKLSPKILSEQYFKSVKLNLSGIVDVLEIHDINGKISFIPVELKTGKFPESGMWEGHKVQLGAYMLLLEDCGKHVSEAVIKYKDTDRRVLQMNTFLRDEILELISKTSNLLNASFPPTFTDNKNKCKSCAFKETCYDEEKIKSLVDVKSVKLLLK